MIKNGVCILPRYTTTDDKKLKIIKRRHSRNVGKVKAADDQLLSQATKPFNSTIAWVTKCFKGYIRFSFFSFFSKFPLY